MKTKILALMLCTPIAFVVSPNGGCKSGPSPNIPDVVEAGTPVVNDVNDVCNLIAGPNNNICATIDEIINIFIPFILTSRSADAGAPANCQMLPGTTFCASAQEIDKAVVFLSKFRAARLMMDAGK